jgi:phospholipase C
MIYKHRGELSFWDYACERSKTVKMISSTSFVVALCLGTAFAGSIKDIKHVVLFMQENRAFDHVSPVL